MPHSTYTTEEIARRGREIYERQIRPLVEPQLIGKHLVVDIESGEYEVGDHHFSIAGRMQERKPSAVLYGMRIGHRAVGRFSGRSFRTVGLWSS